MQLIARMGTVLQDSRAPTSFKKLVIKGIIIGTKTNRITLAIKGQLVFDFGFCFGGGSCLGRAARCLQFFLLIS